MLRQQRASSANRAGSSDGGEGSAVRRPELLLVQRPGGRLVHSGALTGSFPGAFSAPGVKVGVEQGEAQLSNPGRALRSTDPQRAPPEL